MDKVEKRLFSSSYTLGWRQFELKLIQTCKLHSHSSPTWYNQFFDLIQVSSNLIQQVPRASNRLTFDFKHQHFFLSSFIYNQSDFPTMVTHSPALILPEICDLEQLNNILEDDFCEWKNINCALKNSTWYICLAVCITNPAC